MFFNPDNYKPPITAKQSFINWLVLQPANESYNWFDPRKCACARYFGTNTDWIPLNREIAKNEGIDFNIAAMRKPWTYGALLKRIQ